MNFYIYDIGFLIIFTLAIIIFLYKRRHNLKREGVMYLYRTKVGIKFINYIGTKYKKTLSFLGFLGIASGYFLMASIIYFLFKIIYIYLFVPEVVRAIKIPPLMPLIPYIDKFVSVSFLPPFYFTYWIIAIAVVAIFHEFAHGIISKRYGIKIKTTGFGFLGPFLAAFVEPDEKQMQKKPRYQQIAVLSAGTFANLLLTIFFFALLSLFFIITHAPAGAIFNSYALVAINTSSIDKVGNFSFNGNQGIIDLIEENKIGNDLIVGVDGKTLNFTQVVSKEGVFFTDLNYLKNQLKTNPELVALYYDSPALRTGLVGTIIAIDGKKITSQTDLAEAMKDYSPGQEIKIKTRFEGKEKEYSIKLIESPIQEGKAVIGITYIQSSSGTLLKKVYDYFNFFKEPATDYQPKYNSNFIIFVYNLIWWLAFINLSVALMNMLPFTIFDGGRMFMLTIWSITKSQKFAEWSFRIINYLILGAIILLMYGWFIALF